MNFGALPERLAHVRAEIARRQGAAGLTHPVTIVAVTKGFGPDAVVEARAGAAAGERGRRRAEERLPAGRGAGAGAPSGGPGAPGARGAHDDRAVHRGRGAAAAHVPRPPVAARRTEGGWAMAGDALD